MFSLLIEGGLVLSENKSRKVQKPVYIDAEGKKTGIYYCGENACTLIGECSGNGRQERNADIKYEDKKQVSSLRSGCDFVIVLYRGGEAYYRYPTPELRKICHEFVDLGADLVVCYGSHCIGAMEEYKDRTIIYGQGDFEEENTVGENGKKKIQADIGETEQISLLVRVNLEEKIQVDFLPICKEGDAIRLVTEAEAEQILLEFRRRSRMIQVPGEMEALFEEYCTITYGIVQ